MARRIRVESRSLDAAPASPPDAASAFVTSFGLRHPPTWVQVERDAAIDVIASALMNDLVSDAPRASFRHADSEARRFVDACAPSTVFVTNGDPTLTSKGFGWAALGDSGVDTGIVAVSASEVRMFWIFDERG